MAAAASVFLVLSFWCAVLFGAQMRAWSWGPALVALAAALCCAAIQRHRAGRGVIGPATLVIGLATAAWFAWRAWISPVPEHAHADLLLLGAATGCFLLMRLISHDARAEAVLLWGLAGVLLASCAMVFLQVVDPGFSQFRSRPSVLPTGFFGHYNAGANFLFGTAFMLAGTALFGNHPRWARMVWLLIAALAIAAVYFTRSRGAVLGVAAGGLAIAALMLVIGSKRKAPWFRPAAIAFPLVVIALGGLLFAGWQITHEVRTGHDDVTRMMDNPSRLRNYSLAFETTMLHPLFGGGSRSYTWESMQVWDPGEHGLASHLPQLTHNEILQAATDYGLIGAAAVLILLGWIVLRGFWHGRFDEEGAAEKPPVCRDSLRLGGMAALAGIFAQSQFSFVFHLLPGAMLLGLALGRLATPPPQSTGFARAGHIATALLAAAVATAIAWPGVTGTRVLAALGPVYHKIGDSPGDEERLDRFTRAISISPESTFHRNRAAIHHRHAVDGLEIIDRARLDDALADYLAALRLNPKAPEHAVSAAFLYSLAGESGEAERLYEKAARLQGNMEPAFRAHLHQAEHFQRKGARHYHDGEITAAIRALEAAMESINRSEEKSAWISQEAREASDAISLSLAIALEAAGDPDAAIQICEEAFARGSLRFRHHAGMIRYRQAMATWRQRRPAEAYPLFKDARVRLVRSRNHLPPEVSEASVRELVDGIDEILELLRTAGFGDD